MMRMERRGDDDDGEGRVVVFSSIDRKAAIRAKISGYLFFRTSRAKFPSALLGYDFVGYIILVGY